MYSKLLSEALTVEKVVKILRINDATKQIMSGKVGHLP